MCRSGQPNMFGWHAARVRRCAPEGLCPSTPGALRGARLRACAYCADPGLNSLLDRAAIGQTELELARLWVAVDLQRGAIPAQDRAVGEGEGRARWQGGGHDAHDQVAV